MSVLLVLLMMWGVVVTVYFVLFSPQIMEALHNEMVKVHHPAHMTHWGRHASHTA